MSVRDTTEDTFEGFEFTIISLHPKHVLRSDKLTGLRAESAGIRQPDVYDDAVHAGPKRGGELGHGKLRVQELFERRVPETIEQVRV